MTGIPWRNGLGTALVLAGAVAISAAGWWVNPAEAGQSPSRPTASAKAIPVLEARAAARPSDASAVSVTTTGARLQEPPMVRAVLFYSPTCPHCHYVMDEVLPPLSQAYGEQLQIAAFSVDDEPGWGLFASALSTFAIAPERQGVPLLIVGEVVLVGSAEIPEQLPSLIEAHLKAGGVAWPAIPGLEDYLSPTTMPVVEPEPGIVHAVLFWTPDCHACRLVVEETLPPLRQQYADQLDIRMIDVVTVEDVDRLYQVAAALGMAKDDVDLPLLIIGEHVLVGSDQIPADLPGLVERYLIAGGIEAPDVAALEASAAVSSSTAAEMAVPSSVGGSGLAIAVLVGMLGALVYSGWAISSRPRRGFALNQRSTWREASTPLLALIGLGIAAYLAYVETQAVSAVCGPIGDCNAVQGSEYARLFGVLPIGLLGVLGYTAILAVWLWSRHRSDRLAGHAPVVVFGMSLVGVLFSLYLTYLEPFVIRAVCAWCLSSAVIMTLLMLVSLHPAMHVLKRRRRR